MNDNLKQRRMDAYYYGFEGTGCDPVDKILSAVACAGKAYHSTCGWLEETQPRDDHSGETPEDWIQNAAQEAANRIAELEAKLAEALEMALDECPFYWGEDGYKQQDRYKRLAQLEGETK